MHAENTNFGWCQEGAPAPKAFTEKGLLRCQLPVPAPHGVMPRGDVDLSQTTKSQSRFSNWKLGPDLTGRVKRKERRNSRDCSNIHNKEKAELWHSFPINAAATFSPERQQPASIWTRS